MISPPKDSKNINLQRKPFDTGMYRIFIHNIWKYLLLVQYMRKILIFYGKYSKHFVFVPKKVEKYLFLTWNIWKVSNFKTKHLKFFWFLRKTFEKFRICIQNIRNLFDFFPKHLKKYRVSPKKLKSISFISKIFKIKILVLIASFWSKRHEKYWISMRNIR